MHEFSLATEIVEIVKSNVAMAGKRIVTTIELEIGELSGVEEPALRTAIDSLIIGTIMENADIKATHPKGLARCKECSKEYNLIDLFTLCPHCQGFQKEIISGKEFNVLSITAE